MSYVDDKTLLDSYNEIRDLIKNQTIGSITIDYSKLDGETENELRQAISKVLHKRCNELGATLNSAHEFIIH